MFKKVIIGIFVFAAFLVIMALKEPDVYIMKHSVDINSTPENIFKYVNDFHKWELWFYSKDVDPKDFHKTYKGPETGVGAISAWEGKRVGEGQLKIIESDNPKKIVVSMERYKPLKGKHEFIFTFDRIDDKTTRVTWVMHHHNTFIPKLIHAFVSLETMFGKDDDISLSKLKTICEKK